MVSGVAGALDRPRAETESEAERLLGAFRHPVTHPVEESLGFGERGSGQHHQELVATVARDHVYTPGARLEYVGDQLQGFVPRAVAVGIVHELEVINVHEEHHEPLARASRPLELLLEPRLEAAAVVEASQRVEPSLMPQTLLEVPDPGRVLLALHHRAVPQGVPAGEYEPGVG